MAQQNPAQARARIEGMKRQFEQKRQIEESLSGIRNKIGVYSGKGGVGKTTVAVNLAATLANDGAKVGILDIDIDCPNVVRAMNLSEQPLVGEDKKMLPPERFGLKVMSMAFFQENEDEAIIWRGPMIHNAITIMQVLTMDGFVVVTTPQELAKVDAKRSINMIRKLQVNVLGVVENMSGGVFGSGAGKEISDELDLDFLGAIALRPDYQDMSKPTSLLSNEVLDEYRTISEKTLAVLAST